MLFFWNKKKDKSREKVLPEDIKEKIKSMGMPAIRLAGTNDRTGFSKMGSTPVVPASFEWPIWKGKPLAFLMQLKFSEINADGALPYLPTSGLLYVFYDQEQSTWGFDPDDRESWRVLFYPETESLRGKRYPEGLSVRYKEKMLAPQPVMTFPPLEDERIDALELTDKEWDLYSEYKDSFFNNEPMHYLGGYPDPIQSAEMEVECELASNGLYVGDESGYNDPRAQELRKNKDQWVLLLQIDSDDDTEMMWGDLGKLYFWIRKKDLAVQDFSKVWMILQCG